ncbi:MAG: ABC transporter ATP-binding protein [Xenococcaceae cyanobacterium]
MAKVKLDKITRQFDHLIAIENISFEVPDGQFWVLVGPSGCGKSTILRTIAGLDSATSGQLYIDDIPVNNLPARQRDVAMVFQNYALYPHMSVADNLAFGLRMRKADKTQINRRVHEVARSLNIEHLLKRKPKQLSGGQQQRVALGRAIARQPKVFLLDEPLSNLDAQLRDDTRAELKQLHARVGITTIYVTHDQIEAMTLADRLVVLKEGRIQQIGTPQAVYAQPANRMVAAFLGSPPMNILPATFTEGSFRLHHQSISIPETIKQQLSPHQEQSFDLGIRPENIRIASTDSISDLTASMEVEIDLIEPLGKEILVKANLLDSNIALNFSAPGQWKGQKGDRLSVELDLSQLFVFEPNSGRSLLVSS